MHNSGYNDRDLNRFNFVQPATGERASTLHKGDLLVHALKFNERTLNYLRFAHDNDTAYFSAFRDLPDGRITRDWVEEILADENQRETFLELALRAVRDWRKAAFPMWCTTEIAFREFLGETADRWLELLGVVAPGQPTRVVLLFYQVGEAHPIFRPSVLESRWYAQHFPSPPNDLSAAGAGGFAMDLGAGAGKLVPEYVHSPLPVDVGHWLGRPELGYGRLCKRTSGLGGGDLARQRQVHHEVLRSRFRPERRILDWMNTPT